MGLFKYLDSITPKIYILSIGDEITIAKIGYTKKPPFVKIDIISESFISKFILHDLSNCLFLSY